MRPGERAWWRPIEDCHVKILDVQSDSKLNGYLSLETKKTFWTCNLQPEPELLRYSERQARLFWEQQTCL